MEHEQQGKKKKRTSIQVDAKQRVDYVSLPKGTHLFQQKTQSSSESGAIGKSFGIYREILSTLYVNS